MPPERPRELIYVVRFGESKIVPYASARLGTRVSTQQIGKESLE